MIPLNPETRLCEDESISDTDDTGSSPSSHVFRIQTHQSPYLDMFYAHQPVRVTIDSGTTGNMIRHTVIQCLGYQVTPNSQSVHQADGSSPLHIVGETHFPFTCEGHTFTFKGLVVEDLDVDILAGTPFMESNDITVRPAKHHVILGDGTINHYGSQQPVTINSTACRAIVLRSPPKSMTVWPGEFLEVRLPSNTPPDSMYALEPRTDAPSIRKLTASQLWPQPTMVSSVAGKYTSPTPEPHFLKWNKHFCQVHAIYTPEAHSTNTQLPVSPPPRPPVHQSSTKTLCQYDPRPRAKFMSLLDEYNHIFDPKIKGYNAAEGLFEARINMGPVEPTKGQAAPKCPPPTTGTPTEV